MGGGLIWGDGEFHLRQAIPSPREGGDTGKALHGAQQSRGAWGLSHHGRSDSWFSSPQAALHCSGLSDCPTGRLSSLPARTTEGSWEVLDCVTFYGSDLFCRGNQPPTTVVPGHES